MNLLFSLPLIAAMAGNVGVQSAAIIVQSIANNSIKSDDTFSRLFKEFRVGILNGLICSIIIFTGPFITTFNDIIGLIIYFSIGQTLLS